MKNLNFDLLCYTISRATSSTARVYQNGQLLFSHSVLEYIVDPISVCLKDILNQASSHSEAYGVFCTPLFQLYGYFTLQNGYCFIIGPSCVITKDTKGMEELMFSLNIPDSEKEKFLSQLQCGAHISAERLEWIMLLFFHLIDQRSFDFLSLEIPSPKIFATEIVSRNMEQLEFHIDDVNDYNTDKSWKFEQIMISLIQEGQPEKVTKIFHSMPDLSPGQLSSDTLRQSKNLGICAATIASRAAIHGGLDCTTAFRLSDFYIQKIELLKTTFDIMKLACEIFVDYASRVRDTQCKVKNISDVFYLCANYVSKNITAPIRVEDMATEFNLSRSYLSTLFKKQTGLSLSNYILNAKVSEAKRLLLHTNRSINHISAYLSFSSQSHFQNVFRKFCDMTPNTYRKKNKLKTKMT